MIILLHLPLEKNLVVSISFCNIDKMKLDTRIKI